jgi:hypothetical protein
MEALRTYKGGCKQQRNRACRDLTGALSGNCCDKIRMIIEQLASIIA